MIKRFISLSSSELFLRATKFLFFLSIANFYSESVIYEYGFFTALFSIVFVFSDLGYQSYILKELSSKNSFSDYIKYSKLSIFRVLIFIFISLFILLYYAYSNNILFLYIFILFLADAIFAMNFSFYRAKNNSKKETIVKFIIGIVFMLISLLSILKLDSQLLFLILSFSYLIYAIYDASYLRIKIILLFIKDFKLKKYIMISKNSLFIFLGSLFTIAYLRIDILMLDWLNISSAISLYTIASRLLELSLVVPAMISILLLPKLVKNQTINIKKDLLFQLFIGVAVMILFLFLSNFIISILFAKYIQTIVILNILLFVIPFMLINNYGFTFFIAKSMSKYYFIITMVMLLLNSILNIIFIQKYGYIAAAYTTLATEVLGSFIVVYVLRKGILSNKRDLK
ncbi:hypothetical protein ALC152_15620 [Arcobacter sp. 15-2]|uniref:oligosaccharide flippase family protein n=1 Tax=Arcobacter sp. 15-2 TaxID=3374109 RepID=UPI00399D4997